MKKEPKDILTEIGGRKAKITLGNSIDRRAEQKRIDKLNSMRIALTYIESQGMTKVNPKKAIEIADEFLKWLEK